jgi:predicted Zn-dependent protease
VDLVARGIARGIVHDTFTAGRAGCESTGHAHPAPTPYGPFPTSLFMGAGRASKESLLRGIERGIWVTRFHYVNVMDPRATVITGMTRDGTFLVENGQIVRPIRNLRFTEEILGALARVSGVAGDPLLLPTWFGSVRCPAIRVEGFTFTGKAASGDL